MDKNNINKKSKGLEFTTNPKPNNVVKKKCQVCGKEFKQRSKREKSYCSDECRLSEISPEEREKIIAESKDENGKFKKGCQIARLKKTTRSEAQFREFCKALWEQNVSEDEFVRAINALKSKAFKGDIKALKEFFDRTEGKVKDQIEITNDEINWNIGIKNNNKKEEI